MTDAISTFFNTWELNDDKQRSDNINAIVTDTVEYSDPQTPNTLIGPTALNEYVGMFSANAPGWTAKVIKSDSTADYTRVTVTFGGMGPDGKEMMQLGQYFVEYKGDLIARMVGFVGIGD